MTPLLYFCPQATTGLEGVVVDAETNRAVAGAKILVEDRTQPVRTDTNGRFWRPLNSRPHTNYVIHVSAQGYTTNSTVVLVE